ncbi:hypothetical protein J2TS4_53540 [Paenibacillus sp. J2TS4]|nr:hypothetical protein J2TS4_53540 [Paenibacillus sp. J2TS4]
MPLQQKKSSCTFELSDQAWNDANTMNSKRGDYKVGEAVGATGLPLEARDYVTCADRQVIQLYRPSNEPW